jgi:hypothetical protein
MHYWDELFTRAAIEAHRQDPPQGPPWPGLRRLAAWFVDLILTLPRGRSARSSTHACA